MPSERIAIEIRRSLAAGERFEDFAFMFDALLRLRAPYHQDLRQSEGIVELIVCVLLPAKTQNYIQAMQAFRLAFAGVAARPELQAEFSNSVRLAAITVSRPQDVFLRPSLYFLPPEGLRESGPMSNSWF